MRSRELSKEQVKGTHYHQKQRNQFSRYTMSEQLQVSKPNKSILNDKWDVVLSNVVVKTGLGFGAGIVASVLLFKRRAFPVWLGVGFGLGRGYAEGDAIFRSSAGLRTVNA